MSAIRDEDKLSSYEVAVNDLLGWMDTLRDDLRTIEDKAEIVYDRHNRPPLHACEPVRALAVAVDRIWRSDDQYGDRGLTSERVLSVLPQLTAKPLDAPGGPREWAAHVAALAWLAADLRERETAAVAPALPGAEGGGER